MRLLGVVFFTIILSLIGGFIILFSMHWFELDQMFEFLQMVYYDFNFRMVAGLSGFLLILLSFSFFQLILGKMQRERTIAFNNPSGQVTVSLSAVEDFVRRLTSQISEIKESRAAVIVNKKGIQITLNVVLRETLNIPEITLKLQELLKDKVQEILGVEEEILVKINVSKIVTPDDRGKQKIVEKKEDQPAIPFQGYRSA